MTVSLTDLLTIPTKEQVLDKFVGLLRLAGFPTASWQTTSFMRHTVETESDLFVDISTLIQKVAKGGLIKLAGDIDDSWVDLCAENVFAEARKAAIFTQGKATLTDAESSGPHPIAAGAFWIANEDQTLRFVNTTADTIPLGGSVELTFQAESAGTDWNVGVDELTEILTPLPGVTASNIAQDTGTWITQQGADAESNSALATRCLDKWATLGAGANDEAYRYRVTSVSSEITRARIYSPGAGSVRIIIAGDVGPVSTAALTAAQVLVASKRPIGVPDVTVANATVYTQSIAGILYITSGKDRAAVLSAAQASVNAFARALALGSKVSREKLIQALLVAGVEDAELSSPAGDYQLGANEVWIPSYALTTE
jgi:hypothetical protein